MTNIHLNIVFQFFTLNLDELKSVKKLLILIDLFSLKAYISKKKKINAERKTSADSPFYMHYSRKITKLIPDRRRRWGKVSAESSLMFGVRAYLIRRGGTQARAVVVLSPMTAFRGKTENTRARDFFFSSLPFLKKKKKFPSRSVNKIFILSSRDKYANKRGKERERERESEESNAKSDDGSKNQSVYDKKAFLAD